MTIRRLIAVSVACAALAGCGGKGGEAAKAGAEAPVAPAPAGNDPVVVYIRDINSIAAAIEGVHDEASARAAAETIHKSNTELEAFSKSLDSKTDAERMALLMPHMSNWVPASQRLAVAAQKLTMQDPKLMQIIGEELDKMPKLD